MIYVQVRQQNGAPVFAIPCATMHIAQNMVQDMRRDGYRAVLANEGFSESERIQYVPLGCGHSYVQAQKHFPRCVVVKTQQASVASPSGSAG